MNTAQASSDAPPEASSVRRVGRAQTELREALADRSGSSLQKYVRLCVGKPGMCALLNYELRTMLLSALPGGIGLALRGRMYRSLWKQCGHGVVIGRNVTIRHPHRIVLGNRVVIDDNCVLDGKGDAETTIVIGDDVILGRNTVLSCKGGTIDLCSHANVSVNCTLISETSLTIGEKVLLAGHCYLIAGGNHGMQRTDIPVVEQPCEQRGGVNIKQNAWLGAGVTVLDGVTVGRDAIIGAGAVVTRSLAPYDIAVGVPATVVRNRRDMGDDEQRA